MTRMLRIASLPGDGIGREVVPEALRVLEKAVSLEGGRVEVEHLPYGAEHYLKTGVSMPEGEFVRLPRDFDAILVGALGHPSVPDHAHARDILLGLRFRLDLYINLRPIRLRLPSLGPLKDKSPEDVDFVIFRENTEGLYRNPGERVEGGARQEMLCSIEGTRRIIHAAFAYARKTGRKRVCMADKANAMPLVGGIWRSALQDVARDFPEIEVRVEYIDALCLHLVQKPEEFEVIVTGNLFGDILADLGAALQGGLGTAASANLHPGRVGLFEPVHGSAPDIAGRGVANPLATILAGSLLLESTGWRGAAQRVENAVQGTLEELEEILCAGQTPKTREWGDEVYARLL